MKNSLKVSSVALIVIGGVILQSCQKEDQFSSQANPSSNSNPVSAAVRPGIFYGPTVPIGSGTARAWVKENEDGNPVAVGIDVSEKALEKLPDQPASWVLFFPRTKGENFYTHMLVDWNPQGHEPAHVYDLPHFDFHFYWISNEDRLAIGPLDSSQFDTSPDAAFIPYNYMLTPGIVPQMGAHWVDLEAPEFTGGIFTRTFIFGSYHGNFIFVEPMITRAYLLTHPDETLDVRQPSAFQRSGWYPENYVVKYSSIPGRYTISLTGLTFRQGEQN